MMGSLVDPTRLWDEQLAERERAAAAQVYRGNPRLDVGQGGGFREHGSGVSPQAKAIEEAIFPQTPLDYAMMAFGPAGKLPQAARMATRAGTLAMGGILGSDEAEAGPASALKKAAGGLRHYTTPGWDSGKAALQAAPVPSVQTVDNPYRMMFPGIYAHPKEIVSQAAERVVPENPMLKQLWGVTRDDLDQIAKARDPNMQPTGVIMAGKPKGSEAMRNVMTPANEQRLQDILAEAGKVPGLRQTDAWYMMDPMFQRLEKMFGRDEAIARYRHLNTMTGMASPGSAVLPEIQRGTAAHWLENQGRFQDFMRYGGVPEKQRGANFPDDLRYIGGHAYHRTAQGGPMEKYLEAGRTLRSENPKVPTYVEASGVPQTGYQTAAPVGDAHFSRGIGLADTRKGPTDVGASWSRSEFETGSPWWKEKVAAPLGINSVQAQARLWNVLGPQTGVDSPIGAGKLELFSQQIAKAAQRMGVSPETARDLILSGRAGAGVLAGVGVGMGGLARQDNYQPVY